MCRQKRWRWAADCSIRIVTRSDVRGIWLKPPRMVRVLWLLAMVTLMWGPWQWQNDFARENTVKLIKRM